MNWLRVAIVLIAGLLLQSIPAIPQGAQCRTAIIPSTSSWCASEAFVSNHFPGSSTAGDIAVFADTTGSVLKDGGPLAAHFPGSSTAGDIAVFADTTGSVLKDGGPLAALLRSYLAGLTLSNDGVAPNSVLDIAAGVATNSTNIDLISLGAFTKSTSGAWAIGSASHGMGNGLTIAISTWYHVCLANNSGTPDIWFDTSVVCANRPAAITDTAYRRIGSFLTDGSAHIIPFSQYGDEFLWLTAIEDINTATLGTSSTLFTLSVPPGLKVYARIRGGAENAVAGTVTSISSPDETGAGPTNARSASNATAGSGIGVAFDVTNRTNTSGQIQLSASAANTNVSAYTAGWIDRRGRDN
jgi:hypothetical protein